MICNLLISGGKGKGCFQQVQHGGSGVAKRMPVTYPSYYPPSYDPVSCSICRHPNTSLRRSILWQWWSFYSRDRRASSLRNLELLPDTYDVALRWSLPHLADRDGGSDDRTVAVVAPYSRWNNDSNPSYSPSYYWIPLPSFYRWGNSKGIIRWVHGELISRNAKETFLQRRVVTWNGVTCACCLTLKGTNIRWGGGALYLKSGQVGEQSVLMGFACLSPFSVVLPDRTKVRNGNSERGCKGKPIPKNLRLSGWSGVPSYKHTRVHNNVKSEHLLLKKRVWSKIMGQG